MTRNGIAVDDITELGELVRTNPDFGAITVRSRHRWDHGRGVDWSGGEIAFAGTSIPRDHRVRADLPEQLTGTDTGPTPSELLIAALGACVAQAFAEQAAVRGVDLYDLEVSCVTALDLRGMYRIGGIRPGLAGVELMLNVSADASDAVLQELLEAAMAASPIADSVANPVSIEPSVQRR